MKLNRGMLLVSSGIALILIGILFNPSLEPSTGSLGTLQERRVVSEVNAVKSITGSIWFFDNEQITGSVSTNDNQDFTNIKFTSPEGKTVYEESFKRYLWLDFNTNLPPGEFTYEITHFGNNDVEVKLILNIPKNIDDTSKDFFREEAFVPKLVNNSLGPLMEIFGSVILGIGVFALINDKNKTIWKVFRVLLIGTLIFGLGNVMANNSLDLASGVVDLSSKQPIPNYENMDASFLLNWSDYIVLLLLPFVIISVGIIVMIIGGIKALRRRKLLKQTEL